MLPGDGSPKPKAKPKAKRKKTYIAPSSPGSDAAQRTPPKPKAKPKPKARPYSPPASSRSDAGQRSGARTKTPTKTARGPQGLPTQSTSPARKRHKQRHTSTGPQGLPIQHGSAQDHVGPGRKKHKAELHREQRIAAQKARRAGALARLGATFIGNTLHTKMGDKPVDQAKERESLADAYHKMGMDSAAKRVLRNSATFHLDKVDQAMVGSTKAALAPFEALTGIPAAVQGTVESHGKHIGKDLLRTLALPVEIGAGAATLAVHPLHAPSMLVKGGKAFVDEATKPYSAKVKEVKKGGAFDQLSTAATVLPSGVGVAAKLMKVGRVKRGVRIAVSGGHSLRPDAKAVLSRNPIYWGKHGEKRLANKIDREYEDAQKAGGQRMDPVRHAVAVNNRKAGRTVELPLREGHRFSRSSLAGHQRQRTARGRSQNYVRMHDEDVTTARWVLKTRGRLTKAEKRAFHFMQTMGIRTPDQAVELLPGLRERILANRKRDNVEVRGGFHDSDLVAAIDYALRDPDQAFTRSAALKADLLHKISRAKGDADPRYEEEQLANRRIKPQAELLGLKRGGDESFADFAARVRAEAEKHGLAEPTYKPSERHISGRDFISHTLGKGAMKADHAYKGANLEHGFEDWRPEVFDRGVTRNIRARHNWTMVKQLIEEHSLTHEDFDGLTLKEVKDKLHREGIDVSRVAIVNLGTYERKMKVAGENADDLDTHGMDHEDPFTHHGEAIGDALKEAAHTNKSPLDGDTMGNWHVVPMPVYRELVDSVRPAGGFERGVGKVKGWQSRSLLLAGNIPWSLTQVAANAAQATVGSGGRVLNPLNHYAARRWWNSLSEEEKRNLGAIMGIDASGADIRRTHMGVTTTGRIATGFRHFMDHPFWHDGFAGSGRGPSMSRMNPAERLAAADRTQNNYFRVLTTYTGLKREKARELGHTWLRVENALTDITDVFRKSPEEQARTLLDHPDRLERVAESVEDWLGDYTTMTALERRTVNRIPMFYPYLRFSIRLARTVLPSKHPMLTAMAIQLGKLHEQELRDMGLISDDQSPLTRYRNAGLVILDKHGHRVIDVTRINPLLNVATQTAGTVNVSGALGVLPPYAVWLADQLTHRDNYRDREWKVQGHPSQFGMKSSDYSVPTRARIFLDDFASMFYPYRETHALTDHAPVGDDSLPYSGDFLGVHGRMETHYKGKRRVDKMRRAQAKREEAFREKHHSIWNDLNPLMPQDSRAVARAAEDRKIAKVEASYGKGHKKPGPKRKRSYLGPGGSGSSSGGGGGSWMGPGG